MDELFYRVLEIIQDTMEIERVPVAEELASIAYPLKALQMQCYNWRAEKIRKIYGMRIKVKIPSLDVLGMAIFPLPQWDVPIFQFDLSATRKKVIAYINFIPLRNDDAYFRKYVKPIARVSKKYNHYPTPKMPEWMQLHHHAYTIYAMPLRSELTTLKGAVLDYLDIYLGIFTKAEKHEDEQYVKQIASSHNAYRELLVTKDRSRIMLGKLIGKNRANRIFSEVLV